MNDAVAYELLAFSFLLLLWLTCVFEAFGGISGGRIRRTEETDPGLSAKMEEWMEHDEVYRAILKLLMFVVAAFLGIFAFKSLGSIKGVEFAEKWGWAAILAAIVAGSVLCELIARFILYRWDIFVLRTTVPILAVLSKTIFIPLTWALEKVSDTTEDWHKNENDGKAVSVEDEILSYVESYNDDAESDLEEGEKQMIRGILEIGDMSVREIMTPRVDLFALPESATIEEAKKTFIESGHSRIPVYGRSIDEIRGILYAKDFLDAEQYAGKTLSAMWHNPIFIPETKNVGELLEEIKRSRNHFAVIIDEFGGTSGVITFEDIIEEIVGEVHDEYDTELDFKNKPQLMADGSILLEARTPISDINEIADVEIPEIEDADTIGGYICSELGRIPEAGTEFVVDGDVRFTVLEADTRKIITLKLEFIDNVNEDSEDAG